MRIGKSEIRTFRDDPAPTTERDGNGDRIGFIPGGTYRRGMFPALDRALDQLDDAGNQNGANG